MKTKKDRPRPMDLGHQQLWLAVAEAAQKGMACCSEAPTLDAALYKLTLGCAEAGLGIDDELRASLALSEAKVGARLARGAWRRDGFAYGIKRAADRLNPGNMDSRGAGERR